jgi:hypothetical protein
MKPCFKCGKTKTLDNFYTHPQMPDGYLNKCKACAKKDARQNFWGKREYYRQYDKDRENTEHRKQKKLEYQNERRKRRPGKERARRMVMNAIRSGKLIRQPCEVCKTPKAQAHHPDYRRPLFVKWLCFPHHR